MPISLKNEMQSIVLSYPRLAQRLKGREEETAKALALLKEIAADFSPRLVKPLLKLLDWLTGVLYDGLNVESEDGTDLGELVKNNSVVLVPNHQSHADYVALNYYVYRTYGFPVYVAGGINLNVFPIGRLFRASGCFFIRRSFNSDILYRLVLEAYIYYLLKQKKPIEFFFEGGRSRSGKLLSPKFGLYQLVFEAHRAIEEAERHPLKFVPVSIVHEYVPEQKTLSRELQGAEKKGESFLQVLKVLKIFSKDLGTLHTRMEKPFDPPISEDQKEITKEAAHIGFDIVERNMIVTPPALLSTILLDAPTGALKWESIVKRAERILDFCRSFNIPLSPSLRDQQLSVVLERAVDLMIANKKVSAIGRTRFGHVFYFIRPEARLEMLYFKNTVIHHFISAWIVNLFWINIFNGKLNTLDQFKAFFIKHSQRLKMEFSMPSEDLLEQRILEVMRHCLGRKIDSLQECLDFKPRDLFQLASGLSVFARSGSFIVEGYFISARAIRSFGRLGKETFSYEQFYKEYLSVCNFETQHGGVVKNRECLSKPLIRNTLKYFESEKIISNELGKYTIVNREMLEQFILELQDDLATELMFNVRED